jgi:hypothetical protein
LDDLKNLYIDCNDLCHGKPLGEPPSSPTKLTY